VSAANTVPLKKSKSLESELFPVTTHFLCFLLAEMPARQRIVFRLLRAQFCFFAPHEAATRCNDGG